MTDDVSTSRPLRYGATLPIATIDPLTDGWNEASSLVFSRPLGVDAFGVLRGDLVSAWTVDADGRTWTLRPRRGARWHDGAAFVADDLVHTLRLLADPDAATTVKPALAGVTDIDIKNGVDVTTGIGATTGADDRDVVVRLAAPVPGFLALLARACVVPAHRHDRAELLAGGLSADPVGTGPYRLTGRGDGWATFAAHPAFHHGAPAIEQLELTHIADDAERVAALAAGTCDLAQVKPQHVAGLDGTDAVVHPIATRVWRALSFNLDHPLLSQPAVRRALSALIDRHEVVATALEGYGRAQFWPVPPSSWAAPPESPPVGPDVAEATLRSVGWQRGADGRWRVDAEPVALHLCYLATETFRAVATEVIARQFEAFGLTVETTAISWEQYHDMDRTGLSASPWDAIVVGWSGGVDPYDNLHSRYASDGAYNRNGYADAELDEWLDRAAGEPDRAVATDLYRRVLEITHRDSIMAPLANPQYLFAGRTGLGGLERFEVDSFYELTQYAHHLRWAPTRGTACRN